MFTKDADREITNFTNNYFRQKAYATHLHSTLALKPLTYDTMQLTLQYNTTRNDDLFLKKMEEMRQKANGNTEEAIGDLNRCIGADGEDDNSDTSSDEKTLKSSPSTVRRVSPSSRAGKSSAPPPPPQPGRAAGRANGHKQGRHQERSSPPKQRQALDSGL